MSIIAIIPARKGSRRLPHKNIRAIKGKTLVEYAIIEAKKSKYIKDIIITTDDKVVIRIAQKYGLKYRERPKYLCEDKSMMQDVIDDIIQWIPSDKKLDGFVLLQPTSPLRTANHIDKCIELFKSCGFNSVVSVKEIAPYVYYPNGAVCVFHDKIYTENMGFILMTQEESIDIDTKIDFNYAEDIIKKNERIS